MKANKLVSIIAALLFLTLSILTGCGSNGAGHDEHKKSETATTKDTYPVTLTDDEGEKVTIEKKPEKVISVTPSTTEIVYALGLGDKVVGVSDYDNYPPEVTKKEKVGAVDINLEKVLSLQPDLALLDDTHYKSHKDVIKKLQDAGIAVFIINSSKNSFKEAYDSIKLVGEVTGTTKKADAIVKDMQNQLAEIKEKAKAVKEKKKVWVEVSPQPEIYTTGKGTYMQEMLDAIGAENAAQDQQGWAKVSEEQAVKYNPDVIITTYGYYVKNPAEQVMSRKGWAAVPAVKNKQVFDVNSDTVTRPGPRLIEGVAALGKAVYPDVFK
ncbi:ABC transporter substrate-binding protein [Peribacillus kribbensis]|uniref:ABC transporter substrate-binding protein n=1 Tax=Peribacillus kribbensis TaxID=356658 RepID=UPI00040BED45|nr:ABC transporter substrate-binding protein [Peribacillus kribbensis]